MMSNAEWMRLAPIMAQLTLAIVESLEGSGVPPTRSRITQQIRLVLSGLALEFKLVKDMLLHTNMLTLNQEKISHNMRDVYRLPRLTSTEEGRVLGRGENHRQPSTISTSGQATTKN